MPRVMHFELPAEDPERSLKFYEGVFGWKARKWEGGEEDYWLLDTGEGMGINGGLMKRNHPDQPLTNVIDVPDLGAYTAKVEAAGGTIVVPKMGVPGIGWLTYFKDIDGVILGMMQIDSKATA